MRIAMIVNSFPAPSETFILRQVVGMLDHGHSVEIFADHRDASGVFHPDALRHQIPSRTYYRTDCAQEKTDKPEFGRWVFEWIENVRRVGNTIFDVIHCHFGPMGRLGCLLSKAKALSGPLIVSFYGYDLNRYPRQQGKGVYKDLFAMSDLCLAINDFTRSQLLELGCPANRLTIVSVGLDIKRYHFSVRKAIQAGERCRVLTVARLVEKKGLEYAIRAVANMAMEEVNVDYQIVGDGYLRPSLQALIDKLGMTELIELSGWGSEADLLHAYDTASIFLFPSVTSSDGDQETLGLAIQEAQAAGLPVVATNSGGIPESLTKGGGGILVPERDSNALADALNRLVDNPPLRSKFGHAGRKYVETHHDLGRLNNRLVNVYEAVIDGDLKRISNEM